MDMILERVQNKFACIIGELCSEPVVLSKFAIWLDLRLAEYKLKGAISLDCSGENPDPSWLKGHEKPLPSPIPAKSLPEIGNGQVRPRMGPKSVRQRLDPDYDDGSTDKQDDEIVLVKSEPTEETSAFYPTTFLKSSQTRKRSAAETIAASMDLSSISPIKMSRLIEEESTPSENPTNQSLMSIIADTDTNETGDQNDDFKVMISSSQEDANLQAKEEPSSYNPLFYSTTGSKLASASPSSADESNSAQQMSSFQSFSDSLSIDQGPNPDYRLATPGSNVPSPGQHRVRSSAFRNTGSRNMSEGAAHPKLALKNAASAISILTRWLLQSEFDENRPVEDIPPELLDNYLVHFFTSVARKNGGEYQSSGLRRIRESIQYYLKNCGYPESITTSRAFEKSRLAFQQKFHSLKDKEKNSKQNKDYLFE